MDDGNNRVCIRMLGTFELEVNGAFVSLDQWKSKKALTLLKFLAARGGEKVSSDVLVELLWPELDVQSAGPSLHTAVYNARRMIEPDRKHTGRASRLRSSNGLYWYEMQEQDTLDLLRFRDAVRESRTHHSSDPNRSLTLALEAVELYRGDFLVEFLYEDWTTALRETYREMYLDTAMRAAALLAQQRKDYRNGVRVLREAIARDPFREELYQKAVEYLVASERYSDAVQLYKQCSEMLAEEFGLEPNHELKELIRAARKPIMQGEQNAVPDFAEREPSESGAFLCTMPIFESMVQVEERRLRRNKRPFVIMAITLSTPTGADDAQAAIRQVLREGDVICRWGELQTMVLLPGTDDLGAALVAKRLERAAKGAVKQKPQVKYRVVEPQSWEPGMDPLEAFNS